MMIFKFLDGVTADTTGATWTVDTENFPSITIQISITTAASVFIEGRIPGITKWAILNENFTAITTEKPINFLCFPEMRARATGVNGALSVYGIASQNRVVL